MLVTERAFAKINLALDVLGKRPDGFHEVKMVMQSVDLYDEIEIKKAECLRVNTIGAELLDNENNIAFKAAQAIGAYVNKPLPAQIAIKKKIPLAAGLAGGSSDAAAVLRGINRLYNLGLKVSELRLIASEIGSDVAFCIEGGTTLATGRGEVITQLSDAPAYFVVLANPGFEVSTGWVYKNFSRDLVQSEPDIRKTIKAIDENDREALVGSVFNVLELVTAKEYLVIDELKRIMVENGALASLMSGSGPTVFALASNQETAENISSAIKEKTTAKVWLSKTRGVTEEI